MKRKRTEKQPRATKGLQRVNYERAKKFFSLLVVALCFTLSSCVYSQLGNLFDISKADQLKPGISTEADAKALLGEPVSVTTNPDNNHQLLIWQYSYGTAIAVGGGAKLAISFDENGKMIKIVQRTKV